MKKLGAVFLASVLLPFAGIGMENKHQPELLEVSIGGFDGPSYKVFFKDQEMSYLYRASSHPKDKKKFIILPVTDTQWNDFRQNLDMLNIWSWPTSCRNQNVMDGTQWKVVLHYPDRSIDASGSNSYPMRDGTCSGSPEASEDFKAFLKAIRDLTGKDFH
jgi:hypothetical protein